MIRLVTLFLATVGAAAFADTPAPDVKGPITTLDPFNVRAARPALVPLQLPYHLHTARYAAAAVSDGTYIYVIGGANSQSVCLDEIERFDPRTGKSEPWARLHLPRRHHAAVLIGRRIYVLGGFVNADDRRESLTSFTSSVEIIDLDTAQVTAGPRMPTAKAEFACASVAGRIYAIGGTCHRGAGLRATVNTNAVDVLNLATGRWETGLTMPTPRQSSGAAVGSIIVVAGGVRGQREVGNVEAYVPWENLWRNLPPLQAPVSMHATVFARHYLYLFSHAGAIAYDLVTKTSAPLAINYRSAWLPAALICRDKLYLIGGSTSTDNPIEDLIDNNTADQDTTDIPTEVLAGRNNPNASADAIDDIQVFELPPEQANAPKLIERR